MKHLPRLLNLNQRGFDHIFVAVACFVVFGVVGSLLLVASHAYTVHWKGILEEGSGNSGYCLTASGSTNGSKVVLNPCAKTASNTQVWSLNYITHATVLGTTNVQEFTLQSSNGKTECLNNPYGSKTNGVAMQLYTCSSTDKNNLWVWGGQISGKSLAYHQLINVAAVSGNSGICLDDAYGYHTTGNKVQGWACKTSNQTNQSWYEASSSSGGSSNSSPMPAPTDLQAFVGGNNIALVWNTPSAAFKSIQVFRNNVQVATVSPSSNVSIQNQELGKEYDDNAVSAGGTYQYKVRAVSASGDMSAFTPTVTVTQPTSSQPVPNITIDTSGISTSLANYMTTYIVPLLRTWYPKVADAVAYPNYTAPTSYTINFSPNVGTAGDVCYTLASGGKATISCDPTFISNSMTQPDNGVAAVFVHESTHVIQDGFPNDTTGWATEGEASWASDYFARQNINPYVPHPGDVLGGYTIGAFYINYIRTTYNANFPKQLDVALHNNTYTSNLVPSVTGGKSVSQVWQEILNNYDSSYGGPKGALKDAAGKCLEVQNGTVADGTKLVVDSCNGSAAQQWQTYYKSTSKTGDFELISPTLSSGKGTTYCADDSYSGTANGTNIQYWGCDDTKAQTWTVGTGGSIVNENSTTCLDTTGGSTANGTQVIINTCSGAASQKWTLP